jgi:hypothetical protein
MGRSLHNKIRLKSRPSLLSAAKVRTLVREVACSLSLAFLARKVCK